MNRALALLLCLLALAALQAPAPAQQNPAHAPERQPPAADVRLEPLARRLESLDARDAWACFLLAEEIAQDFDTPAAHALARTLFVLAHEADRAAARTSGLDKSVYLALESLANDETDRRVLRALSGSAPRDPAAPTIDESRLALAEAIGLARAGDGRGVRERLRKPGVQALLTASDPAITEVLPILEAAKEPHTCAGCRNKRIVRTQPATREIEAVDTLCPVCRGNPGPSLTQAQLAATLRAEAVLLRAQPTGWAAQAWLDRGSTFDDPDSSDLAARLGVDPARSRWTPSPARPDDPFAGVWTLPVAELREP